MLCLIIFPLCPLLLFHFHVLLVFLEFPQTTRRIRSNLSYEQVHPVTQPGSARALSFIYESHYQSDAEHNNSDVIAFISFSALTDWYDSFGHRQQSPAKLKLKPFKSFKNLSETMIKKIYICFCSAKVGKFICLVISFQHTRGVSVVSSIWGLSLQAVLFWKEKGLLVSCSCGGSEASRGLGFLPVSLCPCGVSISSSFFLLSFVHLNCSETGMAVTSGTAMKMSLHRVHCVIYVKATRGRGRADTGDMKESEGWKLEIWTPEKEERWEGPTETESWRQKGRFEVAEKEFKREICELL